MMQGRFLLAVLVLLPAAAFADGYPTAARADYVLGCMASNGNTRLALEKCSCAIDAIAEQLPFSRYEEAETALRMQAAPMGERGAIFRDPPEIRRALEELRQAQAEATLRCF
ncbi:hypothetical protein [Pseudoroseomonas ludipueritiae]|uniref:Secreted protein n=1 Tax=Pseudoroseomonas ludipueritiae TaxID=198093 RepID=A0ABR7R906_9PROT|nr:hypothetical protein [Pseudoroseomonas ludipueritiae]MBC9178188.1 hypothetical protein [Pseudoroseomonas ludipueritiae]MCG7363433.1 hypothetical protein [Roseomonas sp. ACRSG]